MPRHQSFPLAGGVGLLLTIVVTCTGCQSASRGPALGTPPFVSSKPASTPTSTTIAAQSVLRWSIVSGQNPRSPAVTGRETVAPDGTLRLGPYGSVQVVGLTAEQARAVIMNHVTKQVTDPRVSLQIEAPSSGGPLQRLFSGNGQASRSADEGKGWQYTNPSPGGRLVPVPQTSTAPVTARPTFVASKQSVNNPQLRRVSASEPELAPDPTKMTIHPTPMHPPMEDKPIPREMSQVLLPPYVIDPPDILLVEAAQGVLKDQPVQGQHLVRPDGTIGLGIYGSVRVAGLTLEQAREAVARQLSTRGKVETKDVNVDVLAYNSKVYYIITDGAGYGEQVIRLPITGNENVLDALAEIKGLPPVASKKHIWVARRTPNDGGSYQILPVDWVSVTQKGSTATNYQVMPGDRIYVQSDKLIRLDNGLAKVLNPIERLLGVTLLGSSVVNSIQGRNLGGGVGGIR